MVRWKIWAPSKNLCQIFRRKLNLNLRHVGGKIKFYCYFLYEKLIETHVTRGEFVVPLLISDLEVISFYCNKQQQDI